MRDMKARRSLRAGIAASALLPLGCIGMAGMTGHANAEAPRSLPEMTIDQPKQRPQRRRLEPRAQEHASARPITRRNTAPTDRATAQPGPAPATAPPAPADTQDVRTGTVGVYSNSTSVARSEEHTSELQSRQ